MRIGEVAYASSGTSVKVSYGTNGTRRTYVCSLVSNEDGFSIATRVRPRGYSVIGTFHEEEGIPRIGFEVQRDMMLRHQLSVVGDGHCLVYSRNFDAAPKGKEGMHSAVRAFVRDVSYAIPEVDQKVQAHIAGLESEIEKDMRNYGNLVKQSKSCG